VHPIQIPWTSREEQDEIVESLGSLDDKITLLQKTSVTIESIAHALFKSWFVDFDPVRAKAEGRDPEGVPLEFADLFPSEFENSSLGTIPKGWKVEHLGLHLEVLETGRRPKGGVGGIEEGIPSIGAESIFRVGQFDYSKTKFVSHEFFEGMRSGKLESRDVLLYKDGGKPGIFLPRVSMFGDGFPFDICGINEHVFRIRTRSTLSQSFLYFWLWSDIAMHELKHRGGKAAIPGINQSDVREVPVLVPSKAVLDEFSLIADALISRILSNAKEIRSLGELRDTLLPRIMSGKLRIPNVEEITA
jgi:type I restriction enzyme S subunit